MQEIMRFIPCCFHDSVFYICKVFVERYAPICNWLIWRKKFQTIKGVIKECLLSITKFSLHKKKYISSTCMLRQNVKVCFAVIEIQWFCRYLKRTTFVYWKKVIKEFMKFFEETFVHPSTYIICWFHRC